MLENIALIKKKINSSIPLTYLWTVPKQFSLTGIMPNKQVLCFQREIKATSFSYF